MLPRLHISNPTTTLTLSLINLCKMPLELYILSNTYNMRILQSVNILSKIIPDNKRLTINMYPNLPRVPDLHPLKPHMCPLRG